MMTPLSTLGAGPDADTRARSALHEVMAARPEPVTPDRLSQATAFAMGERRFADKTVLIGEAATLSSAMEKVLGVALPVRPNTSARNGAITVLWLAPNEWLVIAPMSDAGQTRGRLRQALAGIHALVVDVSDRWVALELRGTKVRTVLTKGTSLDIEGGALTEGRCASTSLAQAQVILHQRDAFPTFDLLVDATFAEPLFQWLEHAAEEFGATLTLPDS